MAESPAHKFGQIIGDLIEISMHPILLKFAQDYHLYLDKGGNRPARKGKTLKWVDKFGNAHLLDYVLERGGTRERTGTPVAFIESAWRRCTKHSKNKAQEIQGAILPLRATHQNSAPFCGAILAGVFTDGAISQLKSHGFTTLYIPYDSVIEAFANVGVDASFDESTLESTFWTKVNDWNSLDANQHEYVAKKLCELNKERINSFMEKLRQAVTRQIDCIVIIPLHGKSINLVSLEKAICFIDSYNEENNSNPIMRYEVEIRYTNEDIIKGIFKSKEGAVQFLSSYETSVESTLQ